MGRNMVHRREWDREYRKRPHVKEAHNRSGREQRLLWKLRVFEKLGGKCVKCGISDHRVLQIDHINGGGCRERKKYKGRPSYYKMIYNDNSGKYQLLCANCNWIKRIENGEEN